MSNEAIQLKALYIIDKDIVKMFQTYKPQVLEQIPDENLGTDDSGKYITPKNSVQDELKDYFQKNININEIKEKIHDSQTISEGEKYKIHIRNVFLNQNGNIEDIKIPNEFEIEKHYVRTK